MVMGRVDLQRPLAFLSVGRRVVNEDSTTARNSAQCRFYLT